MALFPRVSAALRAFALPAPSTTLRNPAAWLLEAFGGGRNEAGVAVNERSALQLSTVFSCINVLASDFSSLPLKVYEKTDKGMVPAEDSDLWHLLAVEPNPEMSAVVFWGTLMACLQSSGNAYAQIQRKDGSPIALWPRHTDMVTPRRHPVTAVLYYEVTVDGMIYDVPAKDMLHVPALTLDGWIGLSPIKSAARVIGTAIAAEKSSAGFFGRGSRPSGILSGDMPDDEKERLRIRKSWEDANSGDNQGRTAVMPQGWEWTPITVSPQEAQFLETQKYTREQIAGIFRVPPHMIGDTSRLSNGNHESQSLEYVKFTLRPLFVRFEAEIQRKLMPTVGQKAYKYTARFDTSELERGDLDSMMNAFAVGKQWGFFSTDEIRQKLGMNPVGGKAGSMFLVPLNMVPAESVSAEPAAPEGTEPDPESEPAPAGNGGRNQRKLVERIAQVYGPLFRDAAGRWTSREVRSLTVAQQVLGPTVQAVAEESKRHACQLFRLAPDADLGEEKIVRDLLGSLVKRSAKWTADTLDQDAQQELEYVARSLSHNLAREAASKIVLAA